MGFAYKNTPIFDFLHYKLFGLLFALFAQLLMVINILIKSFHKHLIHDNIGTILILGVSIILSLVFTLYYNRKVKRKHIFYNPEYMKNKSSLPLFILLFLFAYGGGGLLAAYIATMK